MLPSYLVLDLETTGGNPVSDRITEVAAVRVDEGREVARWSTLVDPGTRIPPFIASLTGISDAMVAGAPSFAQIAPRLLELLEGAVLVAHNARFDHGFLKNAFERLQIDLRVRSVCTVRLSRRLYPQHQGHGLDALVRRHGLQSIARHRAMGDVDLVLAWLRLASLELGPERVRHAAQELLGGGSSVPPHLETVLRDIPESPGVYLFYGAAAQPLYIGKSVRLRSRVMAHFQADHKAGRDMRLAQETRRVEVRRTAGALGALLLESRLVKQMQPVHNRRLLRKSPPCGWRIDDDAAARPLVRLVDIDAVEPADLGRTYGVYRSARTARQGLLELAAAHGLCQRVLGLESGSGRCFASQLGQCAGACCGQEDPARHRLRVELALAAQRLAAWPFAGAIGIREHDAARERTDIHLFDQWCHLATVHDASELHDALDRPGRLAFDLDTYRLLHRHLDRAARGGADVIRLA